MQLLSLPLNVIPPILEEELKTEGSSLSLKKNHLTYRPASNEGSDSLVHNSGSKKENPNMNNQINYKHKIVKKVENTLKNFELNSGGNRQEFFKNKTGVIHPVNPISVVAASSMFSDEKLKGASLKLLGSHSQSNSPD